MGMLRKSLFVLVYVLVLALFCEALFGAFYYLKNDGFVAPERMLSANEFLATGEEIDCGWVGLQTVHPYLAHYSLARDHCADDTEFDVNAQGFFGRPIPLENSPDTFDILLTGGSVATYLGQMYKGGPRFLEEALNERFHPPTGSQFRVFNGANGAWAQPQQLIMAILYGRGVDAVVTLEGFNEHWAFANKRRIDMPTGTAIQLAAQSAMSTNLVYSDLAARLTHFMTQHWLTRRSYFLFGIYDIAVQLVKKRVDSTTRSEQIRASFQFEEDMSEADRYRWNIAQYQSFLRSLKDVADRNTLEHAFFLQPVPRIGKKLTEEEKAAIGNIRYEAVYEDLVEQLQELEHESVNVRSLLSVFENVEETIYVDVIHPAIEPETGYGKGYVIMAEMMAEELSQLWSFRRKEP